MSAITESARALTLAMLESGREPMWCVLVVSWYFGRQGRAVALETIEAQARNKPLAEGVENG
jgi:hypothetical protein